MHSINYIFTNTPKTNSYSFLLLATDWSYFKCAHCVFGYQYYVRYIHNKACSVRLFIPNTPPSLVYIALCTRISAGNLVAFSNAVLTIIITIFIIERTNGRAESPDEQVGRMAGLCWSSVAAVRFRVKFVASAPRVTPFARHLVKTTTIADSDISDPQSAFVAVTLFRVSDSFIFSGFFQSRISRVFFSSFPVAD